MKNNIQVKNPVVNSRAAGVMLRWNYRRIEIDAYHEARMEYLLAQEHLFCVKCGRDDLRADIGNAKDIATIDHIIPRSKCGAVMDTSNWQVMCGKCNNKKGNEYE